MVFLRFGLLMVVVIRLMIDLSVWQMRFFSRPLVVGKQAIRYRVRLTKHRRVSRVAIGIDIPDKARFRMHREGRFDRFAKWIGLTHEWQTEDASFDAEVFIVSDDAALLQALRRDAQLRAALEKLLQLGSRLYCLNGELWMVSGDFKHLQGPQEAVAQQVCQSTDVIAQLIAVRDRLRANVLEEWSGQRDPAMRWQALLLSASTICGIAGAIAMIWDLGIGLPRQMLDAAVQARSLHIAAVIAAGFLIALIGLMRLRSRTHLILLEILLVGIPGAWLASHAAVSWINMKYDTSPALEYDVRFIDRHEVAGRRGSSSYYIIAQRWPDERIEPRLQVHGREYLRVHPGKCSRVTWHRGYYGDPWMSAIEPVQGECKPWPDESAVE